MAPPSLRMNDFASAGVRRRCVRRLCVAAQYGRALEFIPWLSQVEQVAADHGTGKFSAEVLNRKRPRHRGGARSNRSDATLPITLW
jgi:hypothetical protein